MKHFPFVDLGQKPSLVNSRQKKLPNKQHTNKFVGPTPERPELTIYIYIYIQLLYSCCIIIGLNF